MSDTKKYQVKKKEHLGWIVHMDDALIEAMVYQQRVENKPDGNFISTAYT